MPEDVTIDVGDGMQSMSEVQSASVGSSVAGDAGSGGAQHGWID